MQSNHQNSAHLLQAIFSVCLVREDAAAISAAVAKVNGSEFEGEFHEYITADRRPQFSAALKNATNCVALVDCDRDPDLALQTIERLQQIFLHKVNLIALSRQADASFLLRAMRAGCRDFLPKPIDTEQLAEALKRFQAAHLIAAQPLNAGKVLSFFGAKGGVGTTALAVHLATHLVRRHHKKVLLIDHQHELGHVGLYLGIKDWVYYFEELVRNVDRLDAELLEGFIVKHPSGLDVLPSPDSCASFHNTPPDAIERVMDYLRQRYDFVLVDSSIQYRDVIQALIAASDEVVMITTPEIAALRDLARHIEHMSLINGVTGKIRVVINRSTAEDAVTPKQVEQAIRFPVSYYIPNNYFDLLRAINAGEPIPPQHRGGFTQAIAKWSDTLAIGPADSEKAAEPKKLFNLFRYSQ